MKYKIKLFRSVLLSISLLTAKFVCADENQPLPILVLATDQNFGTFTGEILRTEGFNEFRLESFSDKIDLSYLKGFDIVILAETSLTDKQQQTLARYVKKGGNLIAFKPDKKLSHIFGILQSEGTSDNGYIAINTNHEMGKGLLSQTLQIHGQANKCPLNGAEVIAYLYHNSITKSNYPAVVENDFGKGHTIAFLYNLPQNIVYTRQGNYRNAGKEMDGIDGIRAMDMFTNGWVDTTKNTLNQADEQMRLLSHCIERMSSYTKPLPHFWYFPDTLSCLVTLTNDGEDSEETEFQSQYADVDSMGAKMTLYIKETELISREWVNDWLNKGFEFAAHFDDTRQAQNPDWKTMDSVIKDLKAKMNSRYGITDILTVTNHWFVWCGKDSNGVIDFAAQAKLEANNGVELDNNYARYDNNSNQGHFFGAMGTNQGNYTGSGLSMKFADHDGAIVNIYQHLCNVYDQQYMEHNDGIGFFNCFKGLMDRSLNNEVYSYVSIKAHNDEYFFSKTPLLNMLAYAKNKGVPVWTAIKLLEFLKAKDETTFTDIGWKNNRLSFKIESPLKHSSNLSCLIPFTCDGKEVGSITDNDITRPYLVKTIKGVEYAMVTVKPGFNHKIEVSYSD